MVLYACAKVAAETPMQVLSKCFVLAPRELYRQTIYPAHIPAGSELPSHLSRVNAVHMCGRLCTAAAAVASMANPSTRHVLSMPLIRHVHYACLSSQGPLSHPCTLNHMHLLSCSSVIFRMVSLPVCGSSSISLYTGSPGAMEVYPRVVCMCCASQICHHAGHM